MRESNDEPKKGAPSWMVTFADMMSLLLTFFVLLLSFSNMEIVKFRTMAGSVKNALGMKSPIDLSDTPMGSSLLPYLDPKEGEGGPAPNQIVETLERLLDQSGMTASSSLLVTKRGVILQLQGDLLFESGKAELNSKVYGFLDKLAAYMRTVNRSVDVAGHTDDVPIGTLQFPSNWELSAARAGRAVRYLVDRGLPAGRVRAIGHADTIPVAGNSTPEGRARNRRVEFVFIDPSTSSSVPQTTLDELIGAPETPAERGEE